VCLGLGSAFLQLNRNKKGITIDLSLKPGREHLRQLLREADIFLVDWYPGLDEDPDIGYEAQEKANPRLVYCTVSPFGEKGPFSSLPGGSELVVQAMAGLSQFVGQPGEPPLRVGADIASLAASLFAFQGVLSALFYRDQHGVGQRIAVSQLGSLNSYLGMNWGETYNPDAWTGHCEGFTSPPWRGIMVRDGAVLLNFPRDFTEQDFDRLIKDLGMDDAQKDPRFQVPAPTPARHINGTVNRAPEVWEKYLSHLGVHEVVPFLQRYRVLALPFATVSQAHSHPQIQTLNMVASMEHPKLGQIQVLHPPWRGPWQEPAPAWLLPV
jgi:formyl-CoA transferase